MNFKKIADTSFKPINVQNVNNVFENLSGTFSSFYMSK